MPAPSFCLLRLTTLSLSCSTALFSTLHTVGLWQIMCALPSDCIENLTPWHHLHCSYPDPGHHKSLIHLTAIDHLLKLLLLLLAIILCYPHAIQGVPVTTQSRSWHSVNSDSLPWQIKPSWPSSLPSPSPSEFSGVISHDSLCLLASPHWPPWCFFSIAKNPIFLRSFTLSLSPIPEHCCSRNLQRSWLVSLVSVPIPPSPEASFLAFLFPFEEQPLITCYFLVSFVLLHSICHCWVHVSFVSISPN